MVIRDGDLNGMIKSLNMQMTPQWTVQYEDSIVEPLRGKGICFVIGGSDGPEADGHASINGVEGHACYYAGIGIILPIIM